MAIKQYCLVSGILFSLVATVHLLRVVFGISVQIDQTIIPMFVSWIGFAVTATLAFFAFRINASQA